MTDGLSLPVWLRQQIQADRELALAAEGYGDGAWTATRGRDGYLHDDGPHLETGDGDPWVKRVNTGVWLCDDYGDDCESMRGAWMAQAEHAARWSPAAVLADLDARLALVSAILTNAWSDDGEWGCGHTREQIEAGDCPDERYNGSEMLRLLAAPYTDRPGYKPGWRVDA